MLMRWRVAFTTTLLFATAWWTCMRNVGNWSGRCTQGFDNLASRDAVTWNAMKNGCGNEQAGDLVRPERAVDGIIGFGQSAGSISSQLYNLGRSPKVFAHRLQGEGVVESWYWAPWRSQTSYIRP